ncbi:MAG: hypothetical protein ABGX26_02925, partial [Nautiliaceae bacterium]
MGFNLTEIAQKVNNVVQNGANVVKRLFDMHYNPTPMDVELPWVDENGQLTTYKVPNDAKKRQTYLDIIGAAIAKMSVMYYVDSVNGNDLNQGTETEPFKTLAKACNTVPVGGSGIIVLKNNIKLNQNIYTKNKLLLIDLNGFELSSSFYETDSDVRMYRFIGNLGRTQIYGHYIKGSKIILPEYTGDKAVSAVYGTLFSPEGSCSNGIMNIVVGYGIEIVDNGYGYLIGIGSNTLSYTEGCSVTYNFDNSDRNDRAELFTGIVKDSDSGNPINVISKVNFSD